MDSSMVMTIGKNAMITAFWVSAPILGVALVVGLLISIFQAATSISDASLNFAPKVIIAGLMLLLMGPWMINKLVGLLTNLYNMIPNLVR
jgi:flagellar biosynthetic protein FliQ